MIVTPSELVALALARHREPWNWTFHFAALGLLFPTLLFHSYLFLAAALILFGAGFFRLDLDVPPDNRWFRFVHRGLEWEKNWIAAPWNRHKTGRFAFALATAVITIWALWTREPAALALIVGFTVLAFVVAENKKKGIDP
jgi:hypothetical protein